MRNVYHTTECDRSTTFLLWGNITLLYNIKGLLSQFMKDYILTVSSGMLLISKGVCFS